MANYKLMHKNDLCGIVSINESTGDLDNVSIYNASISPFLGNVTEDKMKLWWKIRSVPASRKMMMDVIRKAGCETPEEYLAKNLALSMTDCYWICPLDSFISWNQVKLWNLIGSGYLKVPYHNATSYDPNATLGGQMDKYWDLTGDLPILVKRCDAYNGQQAINEAFATVVNRMQETGIPFVTYKAIKNDEGFSTKCQSFTSENTEFIPAIEIYNNKKKQNDANGYEHYINTCVSNGIQEEIARNFMDYQTLLDFVVSNTDRHLMNFGILRDANTFEAIGMAPIFDNGNSMFFRESILYNRATVLDREITSFYKKEEGLLKCVKNKSILNAELLPSKSDVLNFYTKAGIPEEKSSIISENYQLKVELIKDFQKGLTISIYNEKKKIKENAFKTIKNEQSISPKNFVVLSGIPGSGKTMQSKREAERLEKQGLKFMKSSEFYKEPNSDSQSLFVDELSIISRAVDMNKYQNKQNCFTIVSANEIRKEHPGADNAFVFCIVRAQIEGALACGCSVIFDASNINEDDRNKYAQIANKYGVENSKIVLCMADPEYACKRRPDIPVDRMMSMAECFEESNERIPNNLNVERVSVIADRGRNLLDEKSAQVSLLKDILSMNKDDDDSEWERTRGWDDYEP